ncbi:MAG: OmcA/MtrC family decaheme c-type cytochrome [Woeseiaceae bacterium]|nr:OmcA/MtrC family decaheme c-type cytochrome [Woeseiaceae bacterium]
MASMYGRSARIAFLLFSSSFLFACSGDDGPAGPQGPAGPAGPTGGTGDPGPSAAIPIENVDRINIEIQNVTIPAGSPPTVTLNLTNDDTLGLKGLAAGQLRFVISQLSPAPAGSGLSSEWQSYVTRSSAGIPDAQATTETATAGTFVDNDDGTYVYTFASVLDDYSGGPVFDGSKTHRIGVEIRGQAPISTNGIYDFVPNDPAATNLFTRAIVDNQTCNACHDVFGFHGGPRTDITYCVTCHNPSSIDGDTATEAWGGTVDMTAMIHKIHYGAELTEGYTIVGFRGTVYDYSNVKFSQDVRNCGTCHDDTNPNTPDAGHWLEFPSRNSCGSCHDDIDWANGGHPGSSGTGITFTDDTLCADCHGPNSTVNGGDLKTDVVHTIATAEASKNFAFNVVDITNTGTGDTPVVFFSVTDPLNGDAPYNIQTDPEFTTCSFGLSRLAIGIAWNTTEYNNVDSGKSPGLPISINPLTACGGASTDEGGGVFSVTSPIPVPATAMGSLAVTIDGHPAVVIDGTGERIAVPNAIAYAPITDGVAVPRRNAVAIEKCADCHNQLAMHGNNRTDNIEVCVTCHAPNVTDINRRAGQCATELGTDDVTVDMKVMIHALHAGGATGVPYDVCGFGNRPHTFDFAYPGKLNNCEGCHEPGGYYPVDPNAVLATTTSAGTDLASPLDDTVTSPNSAVCSTCHVSNLAKLHMEQNGGFFDLTNVKNADGSINAPQETCQLCHGPGGSSDVGEVHGVSSFLNN